MNIQQLIGIPQNEFDIQAGGPGSGRHSEAGTFKKEGNKYKSGSGKTVLELHDTKSSDPKTGEKGKAVKEHMLDDKGKAWHDPGSHVFKTEPERTAFLKSRFGIDHKDVSAGGPGSGRKPNFGSNNKDILNTLHKTMTKHGLTYKDSKTSKTGRLTTHHYESDSQKGSVYERGNGDHTYNLSSK